MTIESAIQQISDQIDSYGQGTANQPKEGTDGWFMLRALDVGRCYLLRLQQLGVHGDPAAAERFYVQCTKLSKTSQAP